MMIRRLAQIKGTFNQDWDAIELINSIFSSANDVAKVKTYNRSAEFKVSKNNYLSRENVQLLGLKDGTVESWVSGIALMGLSRIVLALLIEIPNLLLH